MRLMGILVVAGPIALLAPSLSGATAITLRSGNGTIGSTDSKITMLAAPFGTPFSITFTSADFAAARSGPGATITGTRSETWKAALDSDPMARWVFDGRDGTALYAIDFTLTASMLGAVSLDFEFLIDNQLGDTNNEGLFVNELPLVGSKRLGAVVAHFQVDQSLPAFDITSLVIEGVNTLYVNQADLGSVAGLLFSATITAVPEPSTALLLASGLAALAVGRRRRI